MQIIWNCEGFYLGVCVRESGERKIGDREYREKFFPGILLQKVTEKWDGNGYAC